MLVDGGFYDLSHLHGISQNGVIHENGIPYGGIGNIDLGLRL